MIKHKRRKVDMAPMFESDEDLMGTNKEASTPKNFTAEENKENEASSNLIVQVVKTMKKSTSFTK